MIKKPVIIIGAPRSGTSLLQKIVREHPDFVSVPKESDIIWNRYVHPSLHNWDYEGFDGDISAGIVEEIQSSFENSALPASTWKKWSGWGLMNHPISETLVRRLYQPVYTTLTFCRRVLPRRSKSIRLVDKSVHCPLWLNLIESVFPDTLYVHITRDAVKTVDSMLDGWHDSERFNTYLLPEDFDIKGYAGKTWNFALPRGWRKLYGANLEEIVSFQWRTIQEAIVEHIGAPERRGRHLHIRLEDLVDNPDESLEILAEFAEVTEGFTHYTGGLPIVNASKNAKPSHQLRFPEAVEKVIPSLEELQRRFGYL